MTTHHKTIYAHLPKLSEIRLENLARVPCRDGEPTIRRVADIPDHLFPCLDGVDRDFFQTHPKSVKFANGETATYLGPSATSVVRYYTYMGHKVDAEAIRGSLGTNAVASYEVFRESDLMYA
jgi:hypothetical protein